jgi:hypothetical protein
MPRSSRYRKLPIVVLTDKRGQLRSARTLRLNVRVNGTFEHVLNENDRLDHVAAKYYRQPRAWWHICDANPKFLSPLALIGDEPIYTDEFPLVFADPTAVPQLDDAIHQISDLNGVEKVTLTHTVEIVPRLVAISPGVSITVQAERFAWALEVVYNGTLLTTVQIGAAITAAGIAAGSPRRIRRIGKRIIIPPNTPG